MSRVLNDDLNASVYLNTRVVPSLPLKLISDQTASVATILPQTS